MANYIGVQCGFTRFGGPEYSYKFKGGKDDIHKGQLVVMQAKGDYALGWVREVEDYPRDEATKIILCVVDISVAMAYEALLKEKHDLEARLLELDAKQKQRLLEIKKELE